MDLPHEITDHPNADDDERSSRDLSRRQLDRYAHAPPVKAGVMPCSGFSVLVEAVGYERGRGLERTLSVPYAAEG